MVDEIIEKKALEPLALRAIDPFENRAIEHAFIPRGSAIRVVQRVRDLEDGSERALYIAALSPLPNGGFEITTLVGENEVFIEVMTLTNSGRKAPSRGRCGRRS